MQAPDMEPIAGMTADEFNEFWEGRSTQWYPPINWINPDDSKLFTEDNNFAKRYITMLYYGQLILFSNELGPQTIG